MQLRLSPVRERIAAAYCVAWFVACALTDFTGEGLLVSLCGGCALLIVAMAATYTVSTPATALLTFGAKPFIDYFFRPNVPAFILAVPFAAATYAGAVVSQVSNADTGLSAVVNAPEIGVGPDNVGLQQGWWLPLLAVGLGSVLALFVLLALVLPARAAYDALALRSVQPDESLELAFFITAWFGVLATAVSGAAAFALDRVNLDSESEALAHSDEDWLTVLWGQARLLAGRGPSGTSYWWTVLAWLGIVFMVVAVGLYFLDASLSRRPIEPGRHGQPGRHGKHWRQGVSAKPARKARSLNQWVALGKKQAGQVRLMPVRERLAVGFCVLWFAACALITLDGDLWYAILLGGPTFLVLALSTSYTRRVPVSALMTSSGSAFWKEFSLPNVGGMLLFGPVALLTYAGAWVSHAIDPNSGLSSMINSAGEYEGEADWVLPLVLCFFGFMVGYLLLLCLVLPARAAYDAVRLRSSDPAEARGLVAYVALWFGILATGVAGALVFAVGDQSDEDSQAEDSAIAQLLSQLKLLTGQVPDGTSNWLVVLAWVGVALLLTSAYLWFFEVKQRKGDRVDSGSAKSE